MLRKIVFVLIALALPLMAAQAVSAQQYPPSGDGTTVPAPRDERPASGPGRAGRAPLARTGTDLALLGGVSVVLVAGGAMVVVASRRRTALPAV